MFHPGRSLPRAGLLIAFVLALLWSGASQAANYDLGTISAGDFESQIIQIDGMGVSFDDTWMFSVGSSSIFVQIAVYSQDPSAGSKLVITDLQSVTSPNIEIDFVEFDINAFTFSDFLPTGNYAFRIIGQTAGVLGGTYSDAIAAVPEPSTALLVAMGLVGFGVRRSSAQRSNTAR